VPRYIAEYFPPIQVLTKPTFRPFLAYVRDFSIVGLGIVCDRFLHPETVVAIQFRRKYSGRLLAAMTFAAATQVG
jgi:hypothetical protein